MKHAAISAALLGVLAAPAFAGDECRTLEDENAELRLMLNHVTTELLRKDAAAKHEVEFQLKRAKHGIYLAESPTAQRIPQDVRKGQG